MLKKATLYLFNPYLTKMELNIHARHAANFRSFMLVIFWIFHFFSRYLEKEIIMGWFLNYPPPIKCGEDEKKYREFSNFFLEFMIEKIPYYWLFFAKFPIIFKYFWSSTNPIIHWYLAKICNILKNFQFLGEISYQIKFVKIRSIS